MKVFEKERSSAARQDPTAVTGKASKSNEVAVTKGNSFLSNSAMEPTKTIRDLARADVGKDNLLLQAREKAKDAMQVLSAAQLKNPWQNRMRVDVEWDERRKSRTDLQATIRSDNGLRRAVVYGTKAGKARTEIGAYNDELDEDGLNAEGREQLQKALFVAREIVTRKKEYAATDDSATESESDASDDDL